MKVGMPWNNLGCLSLETKKFYADVFVTPVFGLYVHDKRTGTDTWYKLPSFRIVRSRSPWRNK